MGVMDTWSVKESGVIHQEFDGEVVVIDLASGNYFSLPGSAGVLWRQMVQGPCTAQSLIATLIAAYDVDQPSATEDVSAFLADLEREGLAVRSAADSPVPSSVPVGAEAAARAPYSVPKVTAFRDLQELFLLDPVHEVDPSAGWPHVAAAPAPPVPAAATPQARADGLHASAPSPAPSSGPAAIRLCAADLVWATSGSTTIVVHRDRGLYCRLDGGAAQAWQALASGAVQVSDPAIASALVEHGFAEPAVPAGADTPAIGGGSLQVHDDLVEQIRPWGQRKRPARLGATESTTGLCDRLDAWFAACVPESRISEHTIAGHRISIESPATGDCTALAQALPPAEPHAKSEGHLLIRVWRGHASMAAPMLANLVESLMARWSTLCGPRGEVIDFHTEVTSAIFDPGTRILSVIDRSQSRAWCVKVDDAPLPFWEVGSPFRFLLHDHFAHHGLQFVHGAAVGDSAGALLIVGAGGSGKSSTALACAASGMRYLGDDYCLVDCASRTVHCLYRSGKLVGPRDTERMPMFAGRSVNPDSFERGGPGKGVYMVDSVVPGSLAASMRIAGIAMPRIVGESRSRVERATAGDALAALVPSTVGQLPGADAADAARLERLVGSCPVLTLLVGRDTAGVAAAAHQAIATCSASA